MKASKSLVAGMALSFFKLYMLRCLVLQVCALFRHVTHLAYTRYCLMILLKLSRMNFPCIVLNKKETQKIQTRSCGIRDYCEGLFFLQNVISVVFSNWDFLMKWKLKFFLDNSEFKVLTRAVEMHDMLLKAKICWIAFLKERIYYKFWQNSHKNITLKFS